MKKRATWIPLFLFLLAVIAVAFSVGYCRGRNAAGTSDGTDDQTLAPSTSETEMTTSPETTPVSLETSDTLPPPPPEETVAPVTIDTESTTGRETRPIESEPPDTTAPQEPEPPTTTSAPTTISPAVTTAAPITTSVPETTATPAVTTPPPLETTVPPAVTASPEVTAAPPKTEKEVPTVEVSVSESEIIDTTEIHLTVVSEAAGVATLDGGQTMKVGTHRYAWTFVPEDGARYETVHGTVEITVHPKVIFLNHDGEVWQTVAAINGQIRFPNGELPLPQTSQIESARFLYWSASVGGEAFDAAAILYDNITLYPVLEIIYRSFRITFVLNGGRFTVPVPDSLLASEKIVLPTPVRSYYIVDGWYTDSDFSKKFESGEILDSDITLYAHWTSMGYIAITSSADFAAIAGDPAGKYYLDADITLDSAYVPISDFSGILDGCGHTIYGLTVSGSGASAGLFGTLSGSISNLNVSGADIRGEYLYAGILAGSMSGGSIDTCAVNGTISLTGTSVYAGGLVGYLQAGDITFCSSDVEVTSFASGDSGRTILYSGCAFGIIVGGNVRDCTASGSALASANAFGEAYSGGFCGSIEGGTLSDCSSFASVVAERAMIAYAGGFAGFSLVRVTGCSASGSVSGRGDIESNEGQMFGLDVSG